MSRVRLTIEQINTIREDTRKQRVIAWEYSITQQGISKLKKSRPFIPNDLIFYLGTTNAKWLSFSEIPLFLSERKLSKIRKLPIAKTNWALDSGGFSELSLFGEWRTTPDKYLESIRRYDNEIGKLEWCAQQDWMCEPFMIKKTGLSIEKHQQNTIDNYIYLRSKCEKIIPVLQGYKKSDYHRHIDQFEARSINLFELDRVGIGSVCRRQGTNLAIDIINSIDLPLHGFGVKKTGLLKMKLKSADSMAWSMTSYYNPPLPGCTHKRCNHCFKFANKWREDIIDSLKKVSC